MTKKPIIKAGFRKTPARSPISAPKIDTAPKPEPIVEDETPALVDPVDVAPQEAPVTAEPVAAEPAPVESSAEPEPAPAPVVQDAAPEVPSEPAPPAPTEAPIAAEPVKKPAPRKPVARKPAAIKPAVIKPVAEPVAAPQVAAESPALPSEPDAQPAAAPEKPETVAQPARWPTLFAKEFAMSTFPSFDFAAPFQTAFADMQEKAKAAYDKSTAALGDYSEFTKGNVEALVEAGKILAAGLQELTSTYVSEGRAGFESLTAEVKELAAAKSPTDFLKLQNDLAKKHFDEAVAAASKHSEALIKLANEAAQPISTRVTLAVEKIKTAA